MEPITHFLTGACLGRAGFNRRTALATATMTLAAEAPDLDVFAQLGGRVFGFAHHRGFTHSLIGLLLVSAVVVGFMYLVWRIRGRKTRYPDLPPRWATLFLLAYTAGLSHILLDFTNSYGVRPFWPFSERWYSWDIIFILEPMLYVLLLGGLLVPALLSLVNEEIGVRRKGPQGRMAATLSLLGVLALYGFRDFEHRRALGALKARLYDDSQAIRVSAYPYWFNPFQWHGVVETRKFFATMDIDSSVAEVDPQGQMRIQYKPEETAVTLAAKQSYVGRIYLDWAKYPVCEVEQMTSDHGGFIVHFKDLRFGYPDRPGGSNVLRAGVRLNRNLQVIGSFMGPRPND